MTQMHKRGNVFLLRLKSFKAPSGKMLSTPFSLQVSLKRENIFYETLYKNKLIHTIFVAVQTHATYSLWQSHACLLGS